MLSIKNLRKNYNHNIVLHDLCLEIKSGSMVGLAGSSGSGKSTLLRCIQGLESIASGTINFNGKIGYIFQDFQLFPHFSVLKNIMYAPLKVLKQPLTLVEPAAIKLLQELGLEEHQAKYPIELSGGQKQRVAVARALIMHPELLLCDEPTSGLDLRSIDNFKKLLSKVNAMGITVVIASHDINFLIETCSRIVVLKNGTIVEDITELNIPNSVEFFKGILL